MKCILCKQGETRTGETTVTLQRDQSIVLVKQVPADICENCGEYYLSTDVTECILARAESAAKSGAELEIFRFAA